MLFRRMPPDAALARPVVVARSLCCLATGVWPLVELDGLRRVRGAKTDVWRVRTVGALDGG